MCSCRETDSWGLRDSGCLVGVEVDGMDETGERVRGAGDRTGRGQKEELRVSGISVRAEGSGPVPLGGSVG